MGSTLITTSDVTSSLVSRDEFAAFVKKVLPRLDKLSPEQQRAFIATIADIRRLDAIKEARTDFLSFFKLINPTFVISSKGHHGVIANAFERMVYGELKRLAISLAPRMSKSELSSIAFPAWALGKHPEWKIIQASSTDDLATDFGRKVKNIISSDIYQEIFPGITLSKDSKASGKFATNSGGEYFAIGMGGRVAGKGADVFICDDLVSEQEARSGDPKVYDSAWSWYQSGPLQRLQPGGRICQIATRWSKADPIGRVLKKMDTDPGADRYESIVYPALDENGESTFPEFWSTEELQAKKNNMLPHFWNAQYQQNPTSDSSSIVPKSRWRKWDHYSERHHGFIPPKCGFVMLVLDTAFTKNKRSNPTAYTVWGAFEHQDSGDKAPSTHIILLGAGKKKMEFGELKKEAKQWIEEWKPDMTLIEAKSSGPMLRSELADAGIFTEACAPKANEDKTLRLNSVSEVFSSGKVWYIPVMECEAVIQEVHDFPAGDEDDYTDTVAYALRKFREGGMVRTDQDLKESELDIPFRRERNY